MQFLPSCHCFLETVGGRRVRGSCWRIAGDGVKYETSFLPSWPIADGNFRLSNLDVAFALSLKFGERFIFRGVVAGGTSGFIVYRKSPIRKDLIFRI